MAIISQKWPPTSQDMAIISQKWPPTSQDMAVISHKWPLTSSRHGGYFPKVAADLCETWRLFLKSGRRPTILRSSLNMAADLRRSRLPRETIYPTAKDSMVIVQKSAGRWPAQNKCSAKTAKRGRRDRSGAMILYRPTTACSPSHPQIFPITPSPPPSPPRPSSTQSDAIEKLLSRRFHAQASTPEECTPLRKTGLQKQSLLLNSSSSLSSPPHPATKNCRFTR